ncbi:Integral membrane protein OS=Streptomyces alboniger OX=132473 GN=CP975_17285 PE=4 SV=1 [Streptomyces alboniger]
MFAAVCVVLSAGGHVLASCVAVPLWTLGAGFAAVLAVALPLAGRARSLPGIAALLAVGQLVLHALFGLGQHGTAAVQGGADASVVERAARLVCGAGAATITPAQAHRILTTAGLGPGGGTGGAEHSAVHQHGQSAASAADGALGSMTAGTTGTVGTTGPMGTEALLPSLPMLVAHLLAALAAGWLLRRGDLALLRLVRLAHGAHGVAEGALVRSLRSALTLVRALRAGLPGAPETTGPPVPRTALQPPPKPRTVALEDAVIRRGPPACASDVELAA